MSAFASQLDEARVRPTEAKEEEGSFLEKVFRQADEFQMKGSQEASGLGGVTSYKGLLRADGMWSFLRSSSSSTSSSASSSRRRSSSSGSSKSTTKVDNDLNPPAASSASSLFVDIVEGSSSSPSHSPSSSSRTSNNTLGENDNEGEEKEGKGSTNSPFIHHPQFDAVVCGGTLGIFAASAILARDPSLRVAVIERSALRGRDQDWNIARSELERIVQYGIVDRDTMEESIKIEFNPMRVGFETPKKGGFSTDVNDVLNVGVSPKQLVERARESFVKRGGVVLENVSIQGISVYDDAAVVTCGHESKDAAAAVDNSNTPFLLKSRLIIDAMGGGSPIAKQARGGAKPDGICLVVGSCARSKLFNEINRKGGDLIYSFNPVEEVPTLATKEKFMARDGSISTELPRNVQNKSSEIQMFWEAFPASSGANDRTTYMFAYMDASATRPSLQRMFQEYFRLLPKYQGLGGESSSGSTTSMEELVAKEDITFTRLLFAAFPSYSASPIQYPESWSRIVAVGDASGVQSPLSFGGFGALLRNLPRTVDGVVEALQYDILDGKSLRGLQPYLPNLASTWMMQRSMSAPSLEDADDAPNNMIPKVFGSPLLSDGSPGPEIISELLANTFEGMLSLDDGKGDRLLPFLQDVVRPGGLLGALSKVVVNKPELVPRIIRHVGPAPIVDWIQHVIFMLLYAAGDTILSTNTGKNLFNKSTGGSDKLSFRARRFAEALKYGSGGDFFEPPST